MLIDDITTADAERDGLYNGYKKAVNGFKNLPVENMEKAAKVLLGYSVWYFCGVSLGIFVVFIQIGLPLLVILVIFIPALTNLCLIENPIIQ